MGADGYLLPRLMTGVRKDRLRGALSRPTIRSRLEEMFLGRDERVVRELEEVDMSACWIIAKCRRIVVAGGVALVLPLSGLAVDNAPPEALNVKVFPDRYIAAGKSFSDLAALETWAKPIRIRVLWLDSCDPASARSLVAAVERFHSVYVEGIQIRTFGPGEPGCALAAALASSAPPRMSRLPASDEYYATDESGRSRIP